MPLPPDELDGIIESGELPASLDLAQLDTRWFSDERWAESRRAFDRFLYAWFLREPRACRFRRLVLYDLPSDAGSDEGVHREMTAAHSAWKAGLGRELANLGARWAGGDTGPSSFVNEVILGRVGAHASLIADGTSLHQSESWTAGFERLWGSALHSGSTDDNPNLTHLQDRDPTRWLSF